MQTEVFQGTLIPFLGTTLGSACVRRVLWFRPCHEVVLPSEWEIQVF